MSLDERRFPAIVPDHTNKAMPASLSDEQIDDCVGSLGMAENSILCGPIEIRRAMRAVIAADRELRQGAAEMPVVAWYGLNMEGYEVVSLKENHVLRMFDAGEATAVPLVLLTDAQAALAAQAVEIADLKNERDYLGRESAARLGALQNVMAERDELAALRKDAERYQYLRDKAGNDILERLKDIVLSDKWDAEIDAAIAKEKAK